MGRQFATTHWSVVVAARDGCGTEAHKALESLCTTYWYPLYAYIRCRQYDPVKAADLTQAFFAELLERESLKRVDRTRGRFRGFLLASLKNFLSHERGKELALKRGGGRSALSLDTASAERRFALEPADELTPAQIFERRWGFTVMERALGRLRSEMRSRNPPDLFDHLKPYLTGAGAKAPYLEVAKRVGKSEGSIKTAVHRLRQRYGVLLRQEIAETVADEAEVDDEVRHLLTVIRPWRTEGV